MATLLLADDSVTIQRVIELTFADEGIRVISVSDGASAIAQIDVERPDIVLADVGMPNVDGYQVATHIKRSAALKHVPVLLLTGAFEPIDEERARQTGCEGVLVKPFEPRQLIRTVRGLLFGQRPADLWPADMPRVESERAHADPAPTPPPTPAEPPAPAPVSALHLVPAPFTPPAEVPVPAPAEVPAPAAKSESLSVPYDAEVDPELAAALARLQFVGGSDPHNTVLEVLPEPAGGKDGKDPVREAADVPPAAPPPPATWNTVQNDDRRSSDVKWDLSAAPPEAPAERPRPAPPAERMSLGSVFSALLEAERTGPRSITPTAAPALSEAAVEQVVQRVVTRMTDELVRKIVLETAERLIREEIDRIKS